MSRFQTGCLSTIISELGKHDCIVHYKYTDFSHTYIFTYKKNTTIGNQNNLILRISFFSVFMATNNKKREIGYLVNSAGDLHPF